MKRGQSTGVTAQKSLGELGLLLLLLGDSGKGALAPETNTSHIPISTCAAVVPKLGMYVLLPKLVFSPARTGK